MSGVVAPPVIELGAPVLGEPEKRALAEVIDDGWLTMGERVRRFELAFAAMHGVDDAVAVHSGTAALQLSLAAFDIGLGDEVLVPSLSFVATASVVGRGGCPMGATPTGGSAGSVRIRGRPGSSTSPVIIRCWGR